MSDTKSPDRGARLTEEQKAIAFHEATERPFSHPLNNEKRAGTYKCAVCGEPLFSSDDKYDSGSGWPSFTRPADAQALGTKTDQKMLMPRTEVHCAKCGAHMGHVFSDGPREKGGQRYCINGAVLDFDPDAKTD
jgi:peptide-methionine (R)-S-oxide reductase